MRLDDIPLFATLKGRLDYLNQRQRVIAENVANADVAGFTPRDLKPQSFSQVLSASQGGGSVQMTVSQAGHMNGATGFGAVSSSGGGEASAMFQSVSAPDSETKMNGNLWCWKKRC